MKRVNTKMWLILACAFIGVPMLKAQEVQTEVYEEIKTPDGNEDVLFIYNRSGANPNTAGIFQKNTPVYFNAPSLPRFAVIGKNRKYYLGIGGYVKTTISYDFNGVVNNPVDFITADIERKPGNNGKLQASAATSNLFFNFVGLPGTANEFGAYVNANFNGANQTFNLQHAYVTYRGFLMGYTTSLFTDAGAMPPTIDFEGPNSATFVYNTILSYKYNFNRNWSMAASIEMPLLNTQQLLAEDFEVENQRVPDIPIYLQYAWNDGGSWVRASSIFRSMLYNDLNNGENRSKFGWGVKLSGAAKLCDWMHIYYQGVYGKGISSYIQDLYGLGLDLATNPNSGEVDRVESWGAYMGVQVNLTKNVFMSTTYGQDRIYMPYGESQALYGSNEFGNYKYAQYIATNLIWNILPNLQTGIEYLWGRKVNETGGYEKANRIQTMLQLSF